MYFGNLLRAKIQIIIHLTHPFLRVRLLFNAGLNEGYATHSVISKEDDAGTEPTSVRDQAYLSPGLSLSSPTLELV